MARQSVLLKRFQRYIEKYLLCSPEDKILLAVSGGVDSMVMLSLFANSEYQVGVAHCNFQLRGEESDQDEEEVRKVAEAAGMPYYARRFETQSEVDTSGDSVQMVARRMRYAWFDELCAEHGYTHIAIAHHSDDSVETFFINLFRGTGLRGLTGIDVVNGKIIRPLLFSTRKELFDYATQYHIHYREDSSNVSTKYVRNKIRLGIIPRLREIAPHFPETMSKNVERLTQAQYFIDQGIDVIRQQVVSQEGDALVVDVSQINPVFPRDFVIFELLNVYGFKSDVIEDLCLAIERKNSGRQFYAKDRVAYVDRERIIIEPIAEEDDCALEATPETRRLYCGNSAIYFHSMDIDDLDQLVQPENIAVLDRDKLTFPLRIRRWQEGDSFVPFGMDGHKKVSDLLVDMKVSLPEKQRQFVVLSGEDIVWVVGRRVDERYKIDSSTEHVLRMTRYVDL